VRDGQIGLGMAFGFGVLAAPGHRAKAQGGHGQAGAAKRDGRHAGHPLRVATQLSHRGGKGKTGLKGD